MKITSRLERLAADALSESLDVRNMDLLVRSIDQYYDLYASTGFPANVPIPKITAAKQIVSDIKNGNKFLQLVERLVEYHYVGHMGRTYQIAYLREIVKELRDQGLIYDTENKIFVEDPAVRRTRNWGTLCDGDEHLFAFLRIDIVANTELVKRHSADAVRATYDDLRAIVVQAVERRNGRIWSWEGDGGLAAFFFGKKHLMATLGAMEIAHELFFYNLTRCRLDGALEVRVAVHSGQCQYAESIDDLQKSDTIRKLVEIESQHTLPNTVSISHATHVMLDALIASRFAQIPGESRAMHYRYELCWEQ